MDGMLLLILAALLLLGGEDKARAAPSSRRETEEEAAADGAALVERANNPRAAAWQPLFTGEGASQDLAAALSRWAGIESSGNPLAVSSLGERGLLQCGEAVGRAVYDPGAWMALVDPATGQKTHAQLALRLYRWLWEHAAKRIANPSSDEIDHVFFAKLFHQWPKDFRTEKMSGPARAMAAELSRLWAEKPKSMHRLRAASVIAFGDPEPWRHNA